ncbi:uncharacterized protein FFB20_14926 [Fusarium fujikuroi]|uniref:Thioesterase domain-containing protein n=2 Tax=Fusarium fujikuroi TaxID=5127 RepID=S0ED41_GIBF5|nr:uncharacterized protein FFUJ_12751 [Fusarium fujikuroi IMI 58289]KLP10412.1 uncharacterized protein Y057_2015 [Fusarium fujikuroi]KLP21517.1 uncharacterized protein LW94_1028 [Fusarium fujikuroi]QGI68479.1 hypothetical protein CEK27_012450 [Fusarium fujikuroi]QGI85677.1 hypothetical protein CEK25_012406 [Fusarium fujikuroi]QGI99371.1 hypothetical protein CEK26_012440 [Fusarium fujikuroi]
MATNSKLSRRYSSDFLSIQGVTFDVTIADPVRRIRSYLEAYRDTSDKGAGFDDELMRDKLEIVSAETSPDNKTAAAVFLLRAGQSLSNRLGNIHGGAVALIYDMCTTMSAAPLSRKGFWEFGGVSRNLSVTYIRPARADRDILVECQVLHIGERFVTIRGQMRDKESGALLSVAEHSKVSVMFEQTSKPKI